MKARFAVLALACALAASGCRTAPVAGRIPDQVPLLPVSVRLSVGEDATGFCASPELVKALSWGAFAVVASPGTSGSEGADARVSCEQAGEGKIRLKYRDADGALVSGFVLTLGADRGLDAAVARLAAEALARDPAVVRSALDAYVARNRWAASQGREALNREDWSAAADWLARGLESDADPAPIILGLYVAHAKLGHRRLAEWYLTEYLVASGRGADSLPDDALAPARALLDERSTDAEADQRRRAGEWYDAWREAVDAHRWNEAQADLRSLAVEEPWNAGYCEAMAKSTAASGWKTLSSIWSRRAALVREAGADRKTHDAILARVRD
jgi:hypothetical protein